MREPLLLFARGVPARQLFKASAGNDFAIKNGDELQPQVQVSLEFDNDGHGLGVRLPSAVVHRYTSDESGQPVFIGEDTIAKGGPFPFRLAVREY